MTQRPLQKSKTTKQHQRALQGRRTRTVRGCAIANITTRAIPKNNVRRSLHKNSPTPPPAQPNTRYARFRGHPQKQKKTQNDSKDFHKIPLRRTDNKPGPSSPCYPSFLAGSGCQDHPKIAPRPPLRQPKSNQDTPQEGQITSLGRLFLVICPSWGVWVAKY